MSAHSVDDAMDMRRRIGAAISGFTHLLPGQAPIRDFVHHNTLHGLEHLAFPEAVSRARRLTGAVGYLPTERYREFYRRGRITRSDLLGVLDDDVSLRSSEVLFDCVTGSVSRREILLAVLLHPLEPLDFAGLNWQIEEFDALRRFQEDVEPPARERLQRIGETCEADALTDLWHACLEALGIEPASLDPEQFLDLDLERAAYIPAGSPIEDQASDDELLTQKLMLRTARKKLDALMGRIGEELTLSGLLQALTGQNLMEEMRPYLVGLLADFLDQDFGFWHSPERNQGFYAAWRQHSGNWATWALQGLLDWRHVLEELPEDPLDAVIEELERLGLAQTKWIGYLERLSLELPGWSGMFLWRSTHAGYAHQNHPVEMLDYLAVRLVLERLFALRLSAAQWGVEPSLDMLRWQMRRCPWEFLVRYALFNEPLPEYLATSGQRLLRGIDETHRDEQQPKWQYLAQWIWIWQQSPAADRSANSIVAGAWPLFRLLQHLGLTGAELRRLERPQLNEIFRCIEAMDPDTMGFVWLRAYENHFRDQIFNALAQNHGRGRWAHRRQRPSAQLVFCMDDREEGTRRHLEEIDPSVETLGAAAHFGIPHNWRGLDDVEVTGLTPVVVAPCNEIREYARAGSETALDAHRRRRGRRLQLRDLLHQEVRRNLLSSSLAIALSAPIAALALAGKTFAPRRFGTSLRRLRENYDLAVPTRIAYTAEKYLGEPAADNIQLGFTTEDQIRRIGNFLVALGLTDGFAPLVVIVGHGSDSDNNPHFSAYNCGACSGNHSGPNARIFAAIANRAAVRTGLKQQGIRIPDDTRFVGAEHDTCSDAITWYDTEDLGAEFRERWTHLQGTLEQALAQHAQERCRKFFSAPPRPAPRQARHHVIGRGLDFSQARPELGHATNACAVIGRRSVSQGAFFDRRAFLISYDPTRDPEGQVLESLLLANGPVGAGINLEYYFSTVDNLRYGAGSKVTHNVSGRLGVLDGTGSDLRTGLPKQMIEIHEAMRLLVVVEARIEVLDAIYARQAPLQQLIGNGWILLAAIDPDTPAIHVFNPAGGWKKWTGPLSRLTEVNSSADYYLGSMEPLEPVLIQQREPGYV